MSPLPDIPGIVNGPFPRRIVDSMKFRSSASNGDYDSVNRLARLALLSAAASSSYPTVGQKFGWSF